MMTPEEKKEKKIKTFFFVIGMIALLIMAYFYVKDMKTSDES